MTIQDFLHGKLPEVGYAVDVGASDGIWLSNSKFLEDRGWTVICVEPNPLLANEGMKNRKIWKQVACGDNDGEIADFFIVGEYPHSSYSSMRPENKHAPIYDSDSWGKLIQASKKTTTIVRTLNSLIAEHQFPRLDFLTIDVEGSELSVLHGIDLCVWTPRIMVLEAWSDEKLSDLINQIGPFGYRHIGNVEYDHIFER